MQTSRTARERSPRMWVVMWRSPSAANSNTQKALLKRFHTTGFARCVDYVWDLAAHCMTCTLRSFILSLAALALVSAFANAQAAGKTRTAAGPEFGVLPSPPAHL